MALEWVDVADSAVKIGLGALITIVGGWITLKLTHLHEIRKEAVAQRLRDIDKKTDRYIFMNHVIQVARTTPIICGCIIL